MKSVVFFNCRNNCQQKYFRFCTCDAYHYYSCRYWNSLFWQKNIREGFYVADKKFFDNSTIIDNNNKFLKILFIGRLVKEKNIQRLAESIDEINNEFKSNHKLIVIGDGYLKEKIAKYKCVELNGIITQDKIIEVAKTCDVFCLPSVYEPWGVVTHEMCCLGLPILISKKCGSSFDLVIENYNGFQFNPLSIKSIKKTILKFYALDRKAKQEFSQNSIDISDKINHHKWSNTLNSL